MIVMKSRVLFHQQILLKLNDMKKTMKQINLVFLFQWGKINLKSKRIRFQIMYKKKMKKKKSSIPDWMPILLSLYPIVLAFKLQITINLFFLC